MKENLRKFREEAQKLEQSEALRTARQKFQAVESEASKGSEVIKEKLDTIKEKVRIFTLYCDNDENVEQLVHEMIFVKRYKKSLRKRARLN